MNSTLTLEYNTQNTMAQRIIEIILAMDSVFKVKTIVAKPSAISITDRKSAASAFLDKWAGKFLITETTTNDDRYNYLVEKYK